MATTQMCQAAITGLPGTLASRYDVSWAVAAPVTLATPVTLTVETGTLSYDGVTARWQGAGGTAVAAPCLLSGTALVSFTLKRRPESIALLRNHQLVLTAPTPSAVPTGTVAFGALSAGVEISGARYQKRTPTPLLGDDFMRKDGRAQEGLAQTQWLDDDTWPVAFYEIDNPGKYPRISDEGVPTINPWLLSLTDRDESSANGFWFLYQGIGPSWAVASPDKAYSFWDRYFFQAAVQPEIADNNKDNTG